MAGAVPLNGSPIIRRHRVNFKHLTGWVSGTIFLGRFRGCGQRPQITTCPEQIIAADPGERVRIPLVGSDFDFRASRSPAVSLSVRVPLTHLSTVTRREIYLRLGPSVSSTSVTSGASLGLAM